MHAAKPEESTVVRVFKRWLTLFSALRFRQFRVFWFGLLAQIVGQHMFMVTVGWLAFDLTGSEADLAYISLAGFVARLIFTLVGGVLADRWDQRLLISLGQAVSALSMVALATLTLLDVVNIYHLAAASFLIGISQSIDEPSRAAFWPRLLPDRSHIPSAVPLISMAWGSMRVGAPAVAGFVIAAAGADTSFFLSAAGAAIMVAVVQIVRPNPGGTRSRGNMLRNLLDGVRYVRADEVFSKIILAGFVHATFSMGFILMLPAFAKEVLSVDERGLGLLAAATGIGSLAGLVTLGFLNARMRSGKMIIFSMTLFSGSLIAFAASETFLLSFGLLIVTGVAHVYFQTSSQVVLQTFVDERYRGRVMSLYAILWSLLLLSGALLNFAAEFVGPQRALTGGTVIVLLYVWLFLVRSPALRNLSLAQRASEDAERAR